MSVLAPNKRQAGPAPTLYAGGAARARDAMSRTAMPISLPTPNGSGPGSRYLPTPSMAAPNSFHAAGSQPAPPSHSDLGPYQQWPGNSQSHAGGGFAYEAATVFALEDDHGLPPHCMFPTAQTSAEEGFLHADLVGRVGEYRSKVYARVKRNTAANTSRADTNAPPIASPSSTKREEELSRKLEQERRTRPEADEAAEEKRRQDRDLAEQRRQARSGSTVSASAMIRRPGDIFDRIRKINKIKTHTSSVFADAQTTTGLEQSKKSEEAKKQQRQVQVDDSDESDDGKKRRSSQPRGPAPRDRKGKGMEREAKTSRLGAARHDGFEDDAAGPSRLESKNKKKTISSSARRSPRKSSKQPALDEWLKPTKEPTAHKATPLLDLFQDEQDPSDDGNVTLSDSSDDDAVNERLRRARADSRFDSPYPEFDPTQALADPDTLCPFCDQPLPDAPSDDLLRKRDTLINDPSARRKSTMRNSKAVRLRDGHVVRTAEFCKQHRDERIFIPQGRAQGWPAEIDWEALPARIEKLLSAYLNDIVLGKVATPFLDNAHSDFSRVGGKRGNAVNDLATFGVEEPGYYGPKGRKVICDAVTQLMTVTYPLLTPHRVAPLDIDFYVRRVLLPECAIELVRDDLGGAAIVSRERAIEVVEDSRGYGKAMFPDVYEGEERGTTQAPVDVDASATDSESETEVEVRVAAGQGRGESFKRTKRQRSRASSSSQSPRRPRKRQTFHTSRDDYDLDTSDYDDNNDEEEAPAATSTKPKVPTPVASTSKGGLRVPKSFLSSGVGGKPSSSGSSATAVASSRSSKASDSTAITLPESDLSEEGEKGPGDDDDDGNRLRPPPSAQARSAKSTAYSAAAAAAASSLFAEMPTSSAAGFSDTSSGSDPDSDDARLDEVVETDFSARAKGKGQPGGGGHNRASRTRRASPLKRPPNNAARKIRSPRKADRARSPQKRKMC